jgi:ubiquinone/menaquinone biosynthesis C-methylase UbiE
MNHIDRINLLRAGIPKKRGVWAEFGSGSGAFTLALTELIDADSNIYSIDKDEKALTQQKQKIQLRFPNIQVHYLASDFSKPLNLPALDGVLMANAIHFVKEKEPFIMRIKDYLKPEGRLLIVEYNISRGNPWVPYPISFRSWEAMARECGFTETQLLNTKPSRYHKEIYSSASYL